MNIIPKQEEQDFEDTSQTDASQNKEKKKYSVITQDVREQFIKRVISREVTIKEAAKEFGIKFSTSKAILQTFKREGRIGKKKTRQRKPKVVKSMAIGNVGQDKDNKNLMPNGIFKTNNMIKKESGQFDDSHPFSPQLDQETQHAMFEIKNIIQDGQSNNNIINSPLLQNYKMNTGGLNNMSVSQPMGNMAGGMGGGAGLIYKKLSALNGNSPQQRSLSINTGSTFCNNNVLNGRQQQQIQKDAASLFPNPFNIDMNQSNLQLRESPLDLKNLMNQLNSITVDQLKYISSNNIQEDEYKMDNGDFNYNKYFQTSEYHF